MVTDLNHNKQENPPQQFCNSFLLASVVPLGAGRMIRLALQSGKSVQLQNFSPHHRAPSAELRCFLSPESEAATKYGFIEKNVGQ